MRLRPQPLFSSASSVWVVGGGIFTCDKSSILASFAKVTCDKPDVLAPHGKVTCDKSSILAPYAKLAGDKSSILAPLAKVTCDKSSILAPFAAAAASWGEGFKRSPSGVDQEIALKPLTTEFPNAGKPLKT